MIVLKMNKCFLTTTSLLFWIICLPACQQTETAKETLQTPSSDEDYLVTIGTPLGEMKAILYEETPKHRENFAKLAHEGYYDGLLFHRVIPKFMVQGGDPESLDAGPDTALGRGGPGYTLPPEFRDGLIHERGALSAARMPDMANPQKESNGSQFFIVQGEVFSEEKLHFIFTDFQKLSQYFQELLAMPKYAAIRKRYENAQQDNNIKAMNEILYTSKPLVREEFGVEVENPITTQQLQTYTTKGGYPPLDGEYTVFGKVIDGLEVIDKVAGVEVDASDRPKENVTMTVIVEVVPKATITEKYGYEYPGN